MAFVRICPRCQEACGPHDNYYRDCGYKIVLYADTNPKRKPKPKPAAKVEKRRCSYCGRMTKNPSGACSAHDDLPMLDLDEALLSGSSQ